MTASRGLPRPVEVAAALVGLAVTSPLLALIALAVRLSSPGPVLFRQVRVGQHGRPFELCKFRTMRAGARGPGVTARDDARVTAVGRILRKTKLDELPELWNVVRGDMALVGPRPEVPAYVDFADPLWQEVLRARPGLTDPVSVQLRSEEEVIAQVTGDREAFYLETLQPYKLRQSAAYQRERTPWRDLQILTRTALAIVRPGRACPPTLDEIARCVAEHRAGCAPAPTPERGDPGRSADAMAARAHRPTSQGSSGVPPALAPWRVYLQLGRISNLPTVWTNVLAGALLGAADVEAITLGALLVALSLFYVGGMYLNDAFDRSIDACERPERPIPAGLISARQVFVLGFGLLGAGVLVLLLPTLRTTPPGWPTMLSGVALAAVIVYYDATHKRDPLSPFVMGLCRVLTYVTAALASAGSVNQAVIGGALVLLAYLIGLTYVAKQETLSEMRNTWPLAFLAAPLVYTLPSLAGRPLALVLWAGLAAWAGYAIALLVRRGRVNIPRAVVSLIAGISLLDALLIAGAGHPNAALLGVAGFGLTLFLQRWVSGT